MSTLARHRALAASGDVTPPAPRPLSIGEVAVGTALGSALFWGSLIAVGALVGAATSNPIESNPFAGFRSFDDCERRARARGVRDPGAYCGAIKHRTEAT